MTKSELNALFRTEPAERYGPVPHNVETIQHNYFGRILRCWFRAFPEYIGNTKTIVYYAAIGPIIAEVTGAVRKAEGKYSAGYGGSRLVGYEDAEPARLIATSYIDLLVMRVVGTSLLSPTFWANPLHCSVL